MNDTATGTSRWSLVGTTALVTGGTKEIGFAIVKELARLGARVHTCSWTQAELDQRLQQWQESELKFTGSVCDVSSPTQREKLMESLELFDSKLNILEQEIPNQLSK